MIDSDTCTTSAAEPISNRCMAEYTTYCTQALEGFQAFSCHTNMAKSERLPRCFELLGLWSLQLVNL